MPVRLQSIFTLFVDKVLSVLFSFVFTGISPLFTGRNVSMKNVSDGWKHKIDQPFNISELGTSKTLHSIFEKLLISSLPKHLRAIFVNGGFWNDKNLEIRCSYGLLISVGILSISFTINWIVWPARTFISLLQEQV